MPLQPRVFLIILLFGIALTAGCTTLFDDDITGANVTPEETQFAASYQIAITQPDARSEFIRMDSDVYNAGEVVEFAVTNTGLMPLECSNTPPDFRVLFQTGSGRWATRMGPEIPVVGNTSYLQKGESTKFYRFVTTGWEPGRYRIKSDCGPEREILVRVVPTPAPAPTTAACPEVNSTDVTSWITIDPVGDQQAGKIFTITGTTNLPVGQQLRYTIFSVLEGDQAASLDPRGSFTTIVDEGTCGTNTWNAMGEIQATGDFFIGISDMDRKTTAIKRFSVYLPR